MNTVSPSPLRRIDPSAVGKISSSENLTSVVDQLMSAWSPRAAAEGRASLDPFSGSSESGIDPLAYQLICSLLPALRDRQGQTEDSVERAMLVLCSHLSTRFAKPQPEQLPSPVPKVCEKVALSPWQERRAKEMMVSHMDRGLSIAQIATECSLSRSHFSRAFKKNTGYSPRDWFLQVRLDKAKALLSESSVSISRISLDCGFADQSHFTRVFTRVTGITPFSWRRSLSGQLSADSRRAG
jgi:AraC family transcriptional regulator